MIIAIVGNDGRRFGPQSENRARVMIRGIIAQKLYSRRPVMIISGACPFGGIDEWAIEEARRMCCPTQEFPPKENNWTKGYKPRNIKLARTADELYCLSLPSSGSCRYCNVSGHLQNGGCWTLKYARGLWKPTHLEVIQ